MENKDEHILGKGKKTKELELKYEGCGIKISTQDQRSTPFLFYSLFITE